MKGVPKRHSEAEKKKFGVKAKLMTFILPAVAIAFVALVVIAFTVSKDAIAEKTEELMRAEGVASANQIAAWERDNLTTLGTAVDTMVYLKMNDDEIVTYEAQFLGTYEDFPNGIYITYDNDKVLDASGWQPEGKATEGTWYLEGITHPEFAFGEPYIDSLTNEYIVTASRYVENLNGRYTVIAADVSLSILSEVVGSMQVVGDGDAFIIDKTTGTILAHKDAALVGKTTDACEDSFYQKIYADIVADQLTNHSYDSLQGAYMVNIQY